MTKRIFIITIIILSFYGCAITASQKKAVNQLGQASEILGTIISKELPILRKDTIEMNMISLELKGAVHPHKLDSSFNHKTLNARINAANALASYGKLLVAFVEGDQTEIIKKNSEELFANISEFNTKASTADFNKISDKYTQLTGKPFVLKTFDTKVFLSVNQSIQGIGGIFQKAMLFYYHYKKAQYLKKIVNAYKDEINIICYLLMDDFSNNEKGLIRDYQNTMDILENSISKIRFMKECCQRKTAVKGYYLLLENKNRMNSVSNSVELTLKGLIDANNTLARYLENRKASNIADIKYLTTKIKDLTESINIISK